MLNKVEIRKKMIELRRQLTVSQVQDAAKQVADQLCQIDAFKHSQCLGYYMATDHELNPELAVYNAALKGRQLCLPVVQPGKENQMHFYQHNLESDLFISNQFGIKEPYTYGKKPMPLSQIDCFLVPLIAFDEQCHRLGHGAGYYDRYFASVRGKPIHKRPVLIGLGYEFQKVDAIPQAPWDMPMDYVVTEQAIYL